MHDDGTEQKDTPRIPMIAAVNSSKKFEAGACEVDEIVPRVVHDIVKVFL